ncbi:hypothetical protein [Bacteroides sp.]|uniref:hypothetical protein n=1 Tax=Bacteroides sp. TaxID=29523 RepID=UPI0025BCB247|nr:hypothetical protein [Bacteroides sp.]
MKELYTTIQNLFSTEATKDVFKEAHLYPPEFIDLYNGQPEFPEEFEFTTPALFLDYSINWERSGAMRRGELTLEVHVLTDPTPETDSLPSVIEGMEKIMYYETISDLLEDLATSETSGLILKQERPITTDYFNYHLLTFSCTISRRRTNISLIGKINNIIAERRKYIID